MYTIGDKGFSLSPFFMSQKKRALDFSRAPRAGNRT